MPAIVLWLLGVPLTVIHPALPDLLITRIGRLHNSTFSRRDRNPGARRRV